MNTCKKCGNQFEGNFCPQCGTKSFAQESSIEKRERKTSSKGVFVGVIVIVLLLAGWKTFNKSVIKNNVKNQDLMELSNVINLPEDEYVKQNDYSKNDYGIYPSDDNCRVMFTDGSLYMIRLDNQKEEDRKYRLYNVALGDTLNQANKKIQAHGYDECGRVGNGDDEDVMYVQRDTRYALMCSVDSDKKIVAISLVLDAESGKQLEELKQDTTQENSESTIDEEITESNLSLEDDECEYVEPFNKSTYRNESGEQIIYAAVYDSENHNFKIMFTAEVLGEPSELDVTAEFVPTDVNNVYTSLDDRFQVHMMDESRFYIEDNDTTFEDGFNMSGEYTVQLE